MKRSLALLTLLLLASLAPSGIASARTTTLGQPLAISGTTAFNQPKHDQVTLTDLRSGKRRALKFPGASQIFRDSVVVSPRDQTIAAVSATAKAPVELSVMGIGLKSRVLLSIPRAGISCGVGTKIVPLEVDRRGTVYALIIRARFDAAINDCRPDADAIQLMRFEADGTSSDLAIPPAIRALAAVRYSAFSARFGKLLISQPLVANPTVAVFDFHSGKTFFNGPLPFANQWAIDTGGEIWSYKQSSKPHASRVTRFNYRTNRSKTVEFPHPRGGIACGGLTVFANGGHIYIYDVNGQEVFKSHPRKGTYFTGQNVCSKRFLYAPRRTLTGEIRAQLFDLAELS